MVVCENCMKPMRKVYHNLAQKENVQIYKCPKCKLIWAPDLDIDTSFQSKLNETKRREALQDAREGEFGQILELMQKHISSGRGLEVGCSYGWFLEKANKYYQMEGIEAEDTVAQAARQKGFCVHTGLFPQNFEGKDVEYDFIIFNNAWEHINHTKDLIKGCIQHLKPGGYLIITIPVSGGGLYKLASCFEHLGRTKELTRLWQLHFHSPHIYYFNKDNIKELMSKSGLELLQCEGIRSIDVNKMQQRFEMDADEKHGARKAFTFKCAYPILRLLPADKEVFLFHYSLESKKERENHEKE